MIKVLMTDSHNDRLLANFYSTHLREFPGLKIGSLFYTDNLEEKTNGIHKRIAFKLNPSLILKGINREIVAQIEKFRPDIMWIFKGMEIFPETIQYARQRGILLMNYNPDHPFLYQTSGSGNDFVKDAIPLYHLHLSYSREILKDLHQKYGIEGKWLPFGYEIRDEIYKNAVTETEVMRGCFVGCADDERIRIVLHLLQNGIPVDVYGPDWKKHLKSNAICHVYDGVYSDGLWNILRKYRFQLNVFRKQNWNSHNMRSFEVPGIGGIMLAPYSDEHIEFFSPDKEAFYFKSDKELIEKARFLLALDTESTAGIRLAARNRSVSSRYSYRDRCEQTNIYFQDLIQTTSIAK